MTVDNSNDLFSWLSLDFVVCFVNRWSLFCQAPVGVLVGFQPLRMSDFSTFVVSSQCIELSKSFVLLRQLMLQHEQQQVLSLLSGSVTVLQLLRWLSQGGVVPQTNVGQQDPALVVPFVCPSSHGFSGR